jgi:hypothetical protein
MMARSSHSLWRRIVSVVVAYAFALQGFVFVVGAASAFAAADNAPFEICHNGGANLPDAPSPAPLAEHCPFCIAGAVYVSSPPPATPHYRMIVLTGAVWPLAAPRLAAFFVNESAWPRGPPATA